VQFADLVFDRDVIGAFLRSDCGFVLPAIDGNLASDHSPTVGELLLHLVYLSGILLWQSNEVERRGTAPLKQFSNYFKLHCVKTPVLCQNLAVTKALMLVDVQFCMVFGEWPVPAAKELLSNIGSRLLSAREAAEQVIFIQNDGPDGELDAPGMPYWQLAIQPASGEMVVRKSHQNVFESNPKLVEELSAMNVKEIELVGFQSELCLRASAIGAIEAGFRVSVSRGLHGTYDGDVSHEVISDRVQLELERLASE